MRHFHNKDKGVCCETTEQGFGFELRKASAPGEAVNCSMNFSMEYSVLTRIFLLRGVVVELLWGKEGGSDLGPEK